MNTLTTLTPMKAVQLVEAAGIEDAQTIVAEFAAAGLIKAYALVIETIDARGASTTVRGGTVPTELWRRVILDGIVADVWASGTFRLAGSEFISGAPGAVVTGITFHPKHIDWLISHHDGVPHRRRRRRKVPASPAVVLTAVSVTTPTAPQPAPPKQQSADTSAIPPGALLASVDQAMKATGLSRGTINNLIKRGTLVRAPTGLRSVRIEVASIRALAGGVA